ncbi:hypothetical protein ONZ45_g249 [Pleurotus djamor]|nr:hypothetical protein ONZ45_g249 [Pleurotus djamor]
MSTSRNGVIIVQHTDPNDFLMATMSALEAKEHSPMIILAHTLKAAGASTAWNASYAEFTSTRYRPTQSTPTKYENFWLSIWSTASGHNRLEIVVMCASWSLGKYPLFLWTPHGDGWNPPTTQLNELVTFLQGSVISYDRVFAVFGPASLAKSFADHWPAQTEARPYYDAYLSYCAATYPSDRLPDGHSIRLGAVSDFEAIRALCYEFAEHSVFYPLTIDRAGLEAKQLIQNQEVWVYDVHGKVTSICAATRYSRRAAVISKVFTKRSERRKGYAERLVRFVTQSLHSDHKKAVLYVSTTNESAEGIYGKVGFVDLKNGPSSTGDGREHWLELGFKVTAKGHW